MYSRKKEWLLGMGFVCALLCGCSPIDIEDGVVVESSKIANMASPSGPSPSPTTDPNALDIASIPVQFIAKKNAADPFADCIFALDPAENQAPRFGVVYANLPDDAIVKIWLRYVDANQAAQGQILYQPVKKGMVKYLFDLPSDTPAQTMTLEASLRTDDAAHPQPIEIVTLLGEHGEYMTGDHAMARELGGYYLMRTWTLEWPKPSSSSDQRVYISDTGAKYHRTSCRHYRASMQAVLLEIASMQGYGACSVCHGND